jgi:hypothetical protein
MGMEQARAGRFIWNSRSISKIFSQFKTFTVNFKDFLQTRGVGWGGGGAACGFVLARKQKEKESVIHGPTSIHKV